MKIKRLGAKQQKDRACASGADVGAWTDQGVATAGLKGVAAAAPDKREVIGGKTTDLIHRKAFGVPRVNLCNRRELQVNSILEVSAVVRSSVSVPDASDNVFIRMRRLSRDVTDIHDAELRPFGISAVQFSLLEMIGRMQPITRADIARKQDLDKSTLTRNLKSILFKGWVEEVHEGANGRNRPIALTRTGEQLLIDAETAWFVAQDQVKLLLSQHGFVVNG